MPFCSNQSLGVNRQELFGMVSILLAKADIKDETQHPGKCQPHRVLKWITSLSKSKLSSAWKLVGGWTNPPERYAGQIGFIFSQRKKYLKPPPRKSFTTWKCTSFWGCHSQWKQLKENSLPRDDECHSQCQVLRANKAFVSCSFDFWYIYTSRSIYHIVSLIYLNLYLYTFICM